MSMAAVAVRNMRKRQQQQQQQQQQQNTPPTAVKGGRSTSIDSSFSQTSATKSATKQTIVEEVKKPGGIYQKDRS